jgi:hypothetical protein
VINLTAESPLSLAQAAKLIPPARNGKRCHLSTLLRWVLKGSKAPDGTLVKLEATRLGSRWVTSREALQRFCDRLTPPTDGEVPVPSRSSAAVSQASAWAAEELERRGI